MDNELEFRARELFAYLDTDLAMEDALPFAVGFLVEKMRAGILAKAGERWRLCTVPEHRHRRP